MAHILFVDANVPGIHTLRLAKQRGHRVSFITTRTNRFYPDNTDTRDVIASLDRVMEVDETSDPLQLIDAVETFISQDPIDHLLTQNEFAIDAAAVLASHFGIHFTSPTGVRMARNKAKAREILEKHGIPSAKHRVVRTVDEAVGAAQEIGYPVILKPLAGADSILAFRADSSEQLADEMKRGLDELKHFPAQIHNLLERGFLIEECLIGELVSAEIGFRDGKAYRFIVSGRPRARRNECVEMGAFMPGNLSNAQRDECFDYAERVCRALGLDVGIFHIELIYTERGPILVEANPRLMGGVMPALFEAVTGECALSALLDIHLGEVAHLSSLPLLPRKVVTTRKLMPISDGVLSSEIDTTWLADYQPQFIGFSPYCLAEGEKVKASQVLARCQVTGASFEEATRLADEILHRFERMLRIDLYH